MYSRFGIVDPPENTRAGAKHSGQQQRQKPKGVARDDGVIEAVDDPHRLARIVREAFPTLLYYRGDFYRYIEPCYVALTDDEVRADVVRLVKAEFERQNHAGADGEKEAAKVTKPLVANIIENLTALTLKPPKPEMPFWLDGQHGADRLIVCRNGILDPVAAVSLFERCHAFTLRTRRVPKLSPNLADRSRRELPVVDRLLV